MNKHKSIAVIESLLFFFLKNSILFDFCSQFKQESLRRTPFFSLPIVFHYYHQSALGTDIQSNHSP